MLFLVYIPFIRQYLIMIIAYCNIFDGIHVQLFSNDKTPIDTLCIPEKWEEKKRIRPDLLATLLQILQKNNADLHDIHGLLVVNGPGKFTAVRTACIIANVFAKEKGVPICPLSAEEYETNDRDFARIIPHKKCAKTDFIEPVFLGPPMINSSSSNA
jgi:hypothetical protein